MPIAAQALFGYFHCKRCKKVHSLRADFLIGGKRLCSKTYMGNDLDEAKKLAEMFLTLSKVIQGNEAHLKDGYCLNCLKN